MIRFQVECPTGSGEMANMREVAEELRRRLISIFLPGADGRRPVFGDTEFQTDPRWNFSHRTPDGDNGARGWRKVTRRDGPGWSRT